MLTPRENFIKFLSGEDYEWAPTSGDLRRFSPEMIPEHVARGMVVQQKPYPEENYGGKDFFNVNWVYQPTVKGSIDEEPLFSDPDDLLEWNELLKFPDLDALDWESCAAENAEYLKTDKLLFTTIYTGYFERLISLIGFENAAMAMIDDELNEAIGEMFDALTGFYIDLGDHLHRFFNIEYIEFHDDWGAQNSPLFSAGTFDEMIAPYLSKLVKGMHEKGVFVELHSCGLIQSFMPNIIATGVDTWLGQPINDKKALVEKYGDRFKFAVQIPLPQPIEDAVILKTAEEMKELYRGRRVWFALPYTLPQEKKEFLGEIMRTM